MTLIQPILILLLAGGLIIYFGRLRSKLLDRMTVLVIAASGMVLVAVPEWANKLANLVGVGRGVDLLFYIIIFGLGFFSLVLFSKIRDLEGRITELTRSVALQNAKAPSRRDH